MRKPSLVSATNTVGEEIFKKLLLKVLHLLKQHLAERQPLEIWVFTLTLAYERRGRSIQLVRREESTTSQTFRRILIRLWKWWQNANPLALRLLLKVQEAFTMASQPEDPSSLESWGMESVGKSSSTLERKRSTSGLMPKKRKLR